VEIVLAKNVVLLLDIRVYLFEFLDVMNMIEFVFDLFFFEAVLSTPHFFLFLSNSQTSNLKHP